WGQEAVPLARETVLPPPEGERGDPEPVKRAAPEIWFNCRRCKAKVRRQGECPFCDGAPLPVASEPGGVSPGRAPVVAAAPVGVAPHSLELDPPPRPAGDEEDDGNPYVLADRLMPRCPRCQKEFSREGAVLCVHCGFDLRTRRKVARTFK